MDNSTSAKIWRGDPQGLTLTLEAAEKLEQQDGPRAQLEAHVLRASAYYSYSKPGRMVGPFMAWRNFIRAKEYATLAYDLASKNGLELTHGQYDTLGTIIGRSWLWLRGDPKVAAKLFADGLALKNIPPHSKALMLIGIAEAYSRLNGAYNIQINMALRDALALKEKVLAEPNRELATKQYFRVLERAMVFEYQRGKIEHATELYTKAKLFAHHPENHVESVQLERLERSWRWLTHPRLWHILLPY